jgi:hypothetical protein
VSGFFLKKVKKEKRKEKEKKNITERPIAKPLTYTS